MPEDSESTASEDTPKDEDKTEKTFSAPKDQGEFDRMVKDRLDRERKKFSDYDDLKSKASKLDEIEAANKSELEKATEKATGAEARATKSETDALRFEIALEKGLTKSQAKRLVGTTREELEADADELLEDLGQANGKEGKEPPVKRPKERLKPGASPDDDESDVSVKDVIDSIPRL